MRQATCDLRGIFAMEKIVSIFPVDISISIVSHAQIGLVVALLADLESHCPESRFEVILTLNLGEELPFSADGFSWPIKIIRNAVPRGFGANHNQAFKQAAGKYFCVLNPDIRLVGDPFPTLVAHLKAPLLGVVAPLVLGANGTPEDSARRFPSPARILQKMLGAAKPDYVLKDTPLHPDWVGGMFMLYPSHIFEKLGGFDEKYFLYYEDVDICARLWLLGHEVAVCPGAKIIHHAQRSSHKTLRYTRWHLASMMRFFLSPVYRQLRTRADVRSHP